MEDKILTPNKFVILINCCDCIFVLFIKLDIINDMVIYNENVVWNDWCYRK